MYAIISDGGRQLKVEEGQEIDLAYRDLAKGDKLTLDRVLAVGTGGDLKLGSPVVSGASVMAEIIGTAQGPKIDSIKFRRRKNSRRKYSHRAMYTRVKIEKIVG
jgi:large subunit ribosomal protein L21